MRARHLVLSGGLVLAAAAFGTAAWLGGDALRPDAILARRADLKALGEARPVATLAGFMALHILLISSGLPIGPPMTLTAGFLFGRWLGTAAILLTSTTGAFVVFAVASRISGTRFAARLRARTGPAGEAFTADLRANAFGYVLVCRLIPVLPFFAVNAAAGLAGVPARAFLAATVLGRLPAAFLYTSLGEELGTVSSLGEIARPRVVLTLFALGLLAAIPVILTHRRGRRSRVG